MFHGVSTTFACIDRYASTDVIRSVKYTHRYKKNIQFIRIFSANTEKYRSKVTQIRFC